MTGLGDERWARLVIFFLVGLYVIVIVLIMIRFLIKACTVGERSDCQCNPWQNFIHETEIRRPSAPPSPPPSFPAALKCPHPHSSSIVSINDEPPPSYQEIISNQVHYSKNQSNNTNSKQDTILHM